MSNEHPPRPTEMCEPVYIDTSNIGKRVSTKKYKQSWHVFFGYYRFGRIKRMRKSIILGKKTMLNKRLGKRTHQVCIMYFYCTITRWNRH